MKISIMQMYKAMNTTPKFVEVESRAGAERAATGKANRSVCLQLIKGGEWCVTKLMEILEVSRSTILIILKDLNDVGSIEFFSSNGKQSKILNVL